jgi:hypothetical protein
VPGSGSVSVTGNCVPDTQDSERDMYLGKNSFSIGEVPAGRLRVGRYREYREGTQGVESGEWVLEVLRAVEE